MLQIAFYALAKLFEHYDDGKSFRLVQCWRMDWLLKHLATADGQPRNPEKLFQMRRQVSS